MFYQTCSIVLCVYHVQANKVFVQLSSYGAVNLLDISSSDLVSCTI